MATVLKCTLRIFMLNGGFYETCQNGVLRRAVTSDEKAKMKADIQHYANLAREVLNGVDICQASFRQCLIIGFEGSLNLLAAHFNQCKICLVAIAVEAFSDLVEVL